LLTLWLFVSASLAWAEPVTVTAVSEVKSIAPGKTFTVGLKFEHEEGWHTYWLNSGNIEQGITSEWELPEGFTASQPIFATPEKYTREVYGEMVTNYAYSHENYVLTEITAPADQWLL
jgi:DsbC/DsbD-like thiol-disulfide interchange protein